MAIATINPATGETLRTFSPFSAAEIERKLDCAAAAFQSGRRTPFDQRARLMKRVADILEDQKQDLARLITIEMGKPIKAAVEETLKSAWGCRYYAENAASQLADERIEANGRTAYVRYQPLGPVLAIMPWNFPFWQVFRFASPNLMTGNVCLLKHASNVPQCALAIEDIFLRAGFPSGAFQTLLIGSDQVDKVISDPRVAAVTLTGSERGGSEIAASAGKHIKKSVLELGGSDPFIVMPSADLNAALDTAVKARTVNSGQSCIAAKRFIIAESIADSFEREFAERMSALKLGDPMDETVSIGPLSTKQGLETLDRQVRESVAAGARIVTGGARLNGAGYYYAPTVLVDIPKDSPAYREELFGPVAAVFRAANAQAAIALANDTTFGLAASVWTNDEQEQSLFIDEIQTGQVFVNAMVASDPRLPFGGVKRSGYGRELGLSGIREFVNIKTVVHR